MLREALAKNGYNAEEKYFHEESRRQIDAIQRDPLKIRRLLRAMIQEGGSSSTETRSSSPQTPSQKKVA
jgi:hypothetical protein